MKRIVLFLITNLAIVLVLSVSMRLLGVEPYLNAQGLNLDALLLFAAIMGFGGAFISLALSKWMAKKSVGAQLITTPRTPTEQWLVQTVARQAQQAGVRMPEVAIWEADEVNAFATGMSRNSSLVAVSTGLLPARAGTTSDDSSRSGSCASIVALAEISMSSTSALPSSRRRPVSTIRPSKYSFETVPSDSRSSPPRSSVRGNTPGRPRGPA